MRTKPPAMFGGPHAYELIPLFWMGLIVGGWLVASHAWMLKSSKQVAAQLQALPRNYTAGVVVTSIAFAWFWLLIAPQGLGLLSKLEMNLGDFNKAKPILRIVVPVALVLFVKYVREFLFVRGLGMVALLSAAPILMSAFQKEPTTRLLLPIFAYVLIIKGMFWVGKPYVFRDAVTWATATVGRFRMMLIAGLVYGALVLLCAILFWR